MWPFQKHFEDAEFVHDFERGRINGVAAEIAQEVCMLFENYDVDSRAGKQEAKHHAGWATAGNATAGLEIF
jgi:hypothetical protein